MTTAGDVSMNSAISGQQLLEAALSNPVNQALLQILPKLDIPACTLTAGCLFQAVWNLQAGQPANWGIKDYDVFYFDQDLSWEAENQVIKRVQRACAHLASNIEVRNQARVHLWYERRFGAPCPRLKSVFDGIDRYLIKATCVAVDVSSGEVYSTHGLDELQQGILRINPLNPHPAMFMRKAQSYQARWPWLKIEMP